MHCSVFAATTLLLAGYAVSAAPLLKTPPGVEAARQIADTVNIGANSHDEIIPNTAVLQARSPVPGIHGTPKPVLKIDVEAAQKAGIQIANEEQGRKNFLKWVADEKKTSPSEVERDFENDARQFELWKKKYFDMAIAAKNARDAASGSTPAKGESSKRKTPPSPGNSKDPKKANVGK